MKPIHLMRWAPADYVNDPAVKLALAQRDFVSCTFYPLFLFHAHIQGGELPADPEELGAILGMRPADVRRALAYWLERGKLKERDGRLYHERVVRDIENERVFREEQSKRGIAGGLIAGRGRPKKEQAARQVAPMHSIGPPLPSPTPLPEPRPAPTPGPAPVPPQDTARGPSVPANPLIAGRRPELERKGYRLIREHGALEPDRDPTDILLEAATWVSKDGRERSKLRLETMTDDHLIRTVRDLERNLEAVKRERGTATAAK
jgi:hypothetical protein